MMGSHEGEGAAECIHMNVETNEQERSTVSRSAAPVKSVPVPRCYDGHTLTENVVQSNPTAIGGEPTIRG